MLVKLPYGMCVNPDIIKLVHVRLDRQQAKGGQPIMTYSVVIKTDDDGFLPLATFAERGLAEELANSCARRINAALGEEDPGNVEPEADDGDPTPAGGSASATPDDDDDW